jgi:predicted transcriptional regulator
MKVHNGMRPQDIVVLLKIAAKNNNHWLMKDLSAELNISASEISESLNRSVLAGLLSEDKKKLMKMALLEFLQYGLKYVYPQHPGAIVRGLPTAYSAAPLSKNIVSEEPLVWSYADGKKRGQAIEPLHPSVPAACMKDAKLYELLALTDALRIGKARERKMAMDALKERIC